MFSTLHSARGGFTGGGAPLPLPSKKRKKGVRRGHPEYLKCSKTVWRPGLRPGPPSEGAYSAGGAQEPHPRSRPYGPRFRPPSANPIGPILVLKMGGVPLFNALVGVEPLNFVRGNFASRN